MDNFFDFKFFSLFLYLPSLVSLYNYFKLKQLNNIYFLIRYFTPQFITLTEVDFLTFQPLFYNKSTITLGLFSTSILFFNERILIDLYNY